MKALSKNQTSALVADFLSGTSQIDLSESYGICYTSVRKVLQKELGTHLPNKARQRHWEDEGTHKVKPFRKHVRSVKVRTSKLISTVKELVENRNESYAEIARRLGISRERVGQVAEMCALAKWDVSRTNPSKRTVRGIINN